MQILLFSKQRILVLQVPPGGSAASSAEPGAPAAKVMAKAKAKSRHLGACRGEKESLSLSLSTTPRLPVSPSSDLPHDFRRLQKLPMQY